MSYTRKLGSPRCSWELSKLCLGLCRKSSRSCSFWGGKTELMIALRVFIKKEWSSKFPAGSSNFSHGNCEELPRVFRSETWAAEVEIQVLFGFLCTNGSNPRDVWGCARTCNIQGCCIGRAGTAAAVLATTACSATNVWTASRSPLTSFQESSAFLFAWFLENYDTHKWNNNYHKLFWYAKE